MVDFNATSSNGAESVSSKAITVDLSAVSSQNVTVNYAITGTATGSTTDYTLANGTLTISAGATTGTITIASIVNDSLDEANETVIRDSYQVLAMQRWAVMMSTLTPSLIMTMLQWLILMPPARMGQNLYLQKQSRSIYLQPQDKT